MNPYYIYNGNYREFRGYMFWNGTPVEITDLGTQEEIKKDKSFVLVDEKSLGEGTQPALSYDGPTCPKCYRHFRRGLAMHIRFCKE